MNFVLTDKVSKGQADCTFNYFKKSMSKLPKSMDFIPRPVLFLFFHFLYTLLCHCIAVLLWHSYILNMAVACFLMQWSVYQGACYYMDFFAKRYESQLAKLDKLEEVVVSTPTLRQGSNRSQGNDSTKSPRLRPKVDLSPLAPIKEETFNIKVSKLNSEQSEQDKKTQ